MMTEVHGIPAALDRLQAMLDAATPIPTAWPTGWNGYVMDTGQAAIDGGPIEHGYRTGGVLTFADYSDCEQCGRPDQADLDLILDAVNLLPGLVRYGRELWARHEAEPYAKPVPVFDEFDEPWQHGQQCKTCLNSVWPCEPVAAFARLLTTIQEDTHD